MTRIIQTGGKISTKWLCIHPFTFHLEYLYECIVCKYFENTDWEYPSEHNGKEEQINYLDVYVNKLQDFQNKAYNYIIEKLKEKYPLLQEKKQGIQYTMMDGPLQILNIAYPHEELLSEDYLNKDIEKELYGKKGLRRVMKYNKTTKKEFEYKESTLEKFGRIFSSNGD